MKINFTNATTKDFENIPEFNMQQRADVFYEYLKFLKENDHLNYRLLNHSGCNSIMKVNISDNIGEYVSFVSNDYLGFTQHPKVKKASIDGIEMYGSGAGASPLIGGHFIFHEILEEKISGFFGRQKEEAIIFTTGYTANTATLQSLLQKEDIAIIDMAVHASVYEGCILTNTKTFPHNNMEALEHILKTSKDKFRTRLVIVDGVYSQDGDVAHLKEIYELVKKYDAFLMVDDAHGIGILGNTGRGALEETGLIDKVDIITGTFSKSFANIGGYVVANKKLISFLKFQSRQHIFSATAPPSCLGVVKAIELVDEEPEWRMKLWENINYLKDGFNRIGLDFGNTRSAIVPVKIGDAYKTSEASKMLIELGIYTNPILYPAVSKKNSRIRMALMATHDKFHLDKTLNAFEDVNKKLQLAKK